MDTLQILNVLKRFECGTHRGIIKNYGVFACDQLPVDVGDIVKRPAFYISNTEPQTSAGRHWISIYVPTRGPLEFFDSFAMRPRNRYFTAFLRLHGEGKKYIYNTKRLQGDFSATCGYYSLLYLRARCRGQSMRSFVSQFSDKDFRKNDKKVLEMYSKIEPKFSEKEKIRALQYGGLNSCNQICRPRRKQYKRIQQRSCSTQCCTRL